ncbi:MAG: benzoyl-CoA reductase subunit D [Myxococcales bacterium]|nr:benzoyl-CoA reductase subunit D [Myxococcales bacterium]MBL0193276.1 benzoyl-CoA reductase subunit D [Myxococcales bacterium]HQY63011.1 BadF/BadG/BcrA/BcrD ATPase family protein [Polyangiaceae bacterium]
MSRPHLSAGVDAGSSAVKVCLVRSLAGEDVEVLATASQRIRRRNVFDVVRATFEEACATAKVAERDLCYVASTGDVDAVSFATGHFYGMTTHARGALQLIPEARAVLDLGALHARALRMDGRGKVLGHRMTSQCASGTGQFLENIARYLGVPLEDVGPLSLASTQVEEVSSVCAVLAETDVINMVARGLGAGDILRGIHLSIAGRLVRLARAAGAEGVVAVTGGLAHDTGLVAVLAGLLANERRSPKKALAPLTVRVHPLSSLAGALGAAMLGAFRFDQLERRRARASLPGGDVSPALLPLSGAS